MTEIKVVSIGDQVGVVRDPSLIPTRDSRIDSLKHTIEVAKSHGEYLELESAELDLLTRMPFLNSEEAWNMATDTIFVSRGKNKPPFPWALPQED